MDPQRHSRFYEREFPDIDENVIVQVQKVDEKSGGYVTLLEYGNREGFINIGEISAKRMRSLAKSLRIGGTEVCMVVSVDEDKGYINLSKKRVAAEDRQPKKEMFSKAKSVHGIMQHVAATNKISLEQLCNKVSWPLHKSHSSAFDAFKAHVNGELDIWKEIDFSQPGEDLTHMQDKLKADIEVVLGRRLTQSMVRLQAKCDVACSEYEGIDAVKEALSEGFKASNEEYEVNIKLVAHPMFALSCMCRDKEVGMSVLEEAMNLIEEAIKKRGGTFAVRSKPALETKEPQELKEGDSSSGEDSGEESGQDETMGNFNADFSDLMKKKVEDDGNGDDE